MKYIVAIILGIIITLLVSPIMLITWSMDGWDFIMEGICELCGIDTDTD
jgi:hypothetical protein